MLDSRITDDLDTFADNWEHNVADAQSIGFNPAEIALNSDLLLNLVDDLESQQLLVFGFAVASDVVQRHHDHMLGVTLMTQYMSHRITR